MDDRTVDERPVRAETAGLSRELIVDACVRIADREGANAVTLRRMGRELGVDATALYRHFRNKDDLLLAAAERLLAEALDGAEIRGTWQERLRHLALHVRRVYLAHPGLVVLVSTAPGPLPSEARATELGLSILRDAGLGVPDAVVAFEVFQDLVLGFTAMDAGRAGNPEDAWRRQFTGLPRSAYPNLADAGDLLYRDPEVRFRGGLDLFIEAIEARLR